MYVVAFDCCMASFTLVRESAAVHIEEKLISVAPLLRNLRHDGNIFKMLRFKSFYNCLKVIIFIARLCPAAVWKFVHKIVLLNSFFNFKSQMFFYKNKDIR